MASSSISYSPQQQQGQMKSDVPIIDFGNGSVGVLKQLISPRKLSNLLDAKMNDEDERVKKASTNSNKSLYQTLYYQPTESGFDEDEVDLMNSLRQLAVDDTRLRQQAELFYLQTIVEHPDMKNSIINSTSDQIYERFKYAAENALTYDWVEDKALQFNPAERDIFMVAISAIKSYQEYHRAFYLVMIHDRGHPGRATACIERSYPTNIFSQTPYLIFSDPFMAYNVRSKMIRLHPNMNFMRAIPDLSDSEILLLNWENVLDRIIFTKEQIKLEEPVKKISYYLAKIHHCSWKQIKLFIGYEQYQLDPGTTFYNQHIQYGTAIFFRF